MRGKRPDSPFSNPRGTADKKLDTLTVPGLEVRMHTKEEVELFLLARGDGIDVAILNWTVG